MGDLELARGSIAEQRCFRYNGGISSKKGTA